MKTKILKPEFPVTGEPEDEKAYQEQEAEYQKYKATQPKIDGSIFIYDFPGQVIREKVMKPSNFDNYTNGFPEGAFFKSELKVFDEYKKHLASRRIFSYPVSKEQDGKELREGVDFEIDYSNAVMKQGQEQINPIAIPIDNIGETDHQYEEGLPDKPEQVNNMNELAHLYAKEKSINGVDYKIVKRDFIAGYKAALSSPPDPASKEQENDAVGFAEWIMENGWIPDKEYKQWMKMIKGKWKDLTAEQLYQLYKSKP